MTSAAAHVLVLLMKKELLALVKNAFQALFILNLRRILRWQLFLCEWLVFQHLSHVHRTYCTGTSRAGMPNSCKVALLFWKYWFQKSLSAFMA